MSSTTNDITIYWVVLIGAIYGLLAGLIVFSYMAIVLGMSINILPSCLLIGILFGIIVAIVIHLSINKIKRKTSEDKGQMLNETAQNYRTRNGV